MSKISRTDLTDVEIVDATELASDGYATYRTLSLASTTAVTREVVVTGGALDIITDKIDEPLEVGDGVVIAGNAAAGTYTVESITDDTTFVVVESIVDSVGGTATFSHPAGATKVGADTNNMNFSSADNVQEVLEDLDANITGFDEDRIVVSEDGEVVVSEDGNVVVSDP